MRLNTGVPALLGRYRSSGGGCNLAAVGGDGSVFAASSNCSRGLKPRAFQRNNIGQLRVCTDGWGFAARSDRNQRLQPRGGRGCRSRLKAGARKREVQSATYKDCRHHALSPATDNVIVSAKAARGCAVSEDTSERVFGNAGGVRS